jgi:DNA segregation ATPase FtsK/SpoIIIE, S-DNA-T family
MNQPYQRQREIIGVLLIIIGILVAISLATFSQNDELAVDRYFLIENSMGIAGVFISYFLIKFGFGYFSWGFVVLILVWGWWLFAQKVLTALFRFSFYLLILMFLGSSLISVPFIQHQFGLPTDYSSGGAIGGVSAHFLLDWFGRWPTIFLLFSMLFISIFSYFYWSMYAPFRKFSQWFKDQSEAIKHRKAQRKAKVKSEKPIPEAKPDTFGEDDLPPLDVPIPKETSLTQNDIPNELIKTPPIKQEPAKSETIEEEKPPLQQQNSAIAAQKKESQPEQAFATDAEAEAEGFEVEEKRSDDIVNYDEVVKSLQKKELYKLPSVDLLETPPASQDIDEEELNENAKLLTQTLADFKVEGKVNRVVPGPVVTLYEVEPAVGVRVNRISVLADDIARVMAALRIRIIAPIPGKTVVGVEIPNKHPEIVYFKSIVNSEKFLKSDGLLTIALGKTANGEPFVFNLAKMPHILIAGTTGSGKSVCINTIIMSILYRAKPDQVKLILVDPKKLELSVYKALVNYHLITSEDIDEYVITSPNNAVMALRSAEVEMERRYTTLAAVNVRNIDEYNAKSERTGEYPPLPYIVVVIDELADLMITASREIEEPIARLAQMARAVGIHLVVATQRPSVDVITGVIRANFPARIGFQVPTKIDSRTILDTGGAEKLLGKGDMLYLAPGSSEPTRVHNSFLILEEIEKVMEHITDQPQETEEYLLPTAKKPEDNDNDDGFGVDDSNDPLFDEALRLIVQHQQGSISLIQRRLKVGYSRASRLIDQLERAGIVGPFTGSKAREVLVDTDYLERRREFEDGSFDDD